MKKSLLTLAILLCVSIILHGQSYSELITEALQLYQKKEFAQSKFVFQQAFKIEDGKPNDFYNGACVSALSGDKQTALKLLQKAVDAGYTGVDHMKKDDDLKTLHDTKKWERIISEAQQKLDIIEAKYNKPLRAQLLTILEDDQNIRKQLSLIGREKGWEHPKTDSLRKLMSYQDSVNLSKVEKILGTHGWIGKDIVGKDANTAIFLVIQHNDLKTQQKYLPMMREAVRKGNAKASSLALLEDRVALRSGGKQIYGSQIGINPNTKERYVLPLEDPKNVDKRRSKVGLSKLQDYINYWNMKWDVEEYESQLSKYEEWSKNNF